MVNLFVEFRFQLFNMITLLNFKSAENKQEISHLFLQPLEAFRFLKMWEFLSRDRCSLTDHVNLYCVFIMADDDVRNIETCSKN